MRKSMLIVGSILCLFILVMIPNISAVEHNALVEEKKSQMIEFADITSFNRFDLFNKPIDKSSLNLIKIYLIIDVIVFICATIWHLAFGWNILESIESGLRYALFWPWFLFVYILALIYGWGPVMMWYK